MWHALEAVAATSRAGLDDVSRGVTADGGLSRVLCTCPRVLSFSEAERLASGGSLGRLALDRLYNLQAVQEVGGALGV